MGGVVAAGGAPRGARLSGKGALLPSHESSASWRGFEPSPCPCCASGLHPIVRVLNLKSKGQSREKKGICSRFQEDCGLKWTNRLVRELSDTY